MQIIGRDRPMNMFISYTATPFDLRGKSRRKLGALQHLFSSGINDVDSLHGREPVRACLAVACR
jgi:hypothetical protein